jgi:hypothetical protein
MKEINIREIMDSKWLKLVDSLAFKAMVEW